MEQSLKKHPRIDVADVLRGFAVMGIILLLGTTESLALGIVLFVLQLAFCRWWMKSHTHGPLEYVWKRLTWLGAGRNAIQK